jgi:predicted CXXCH cytochrome family protein
MKRTILLSIGLGMALLYATAGAQQDSVMNTKHNLGATGPGAFRAVDESRICIFCHTPHRARTNAPLWNREDSRETYLTYASSSFGGVTHQPNGGSKLCLSCHDGSIALGSVVSMQQEIEMDPGHRFLNTGSAFVGVNLLDDHPISFDYAASKGGSGVDYRLPEAITAPVKLDDQGYVQCTSCHDPHDNTNGDFMRTTDLRSELCLACHDPQAWATSSHALSPATWTGSGEDPWPQARHNTVADNACANCHTSHNAGHMSRLLVFQPEEENCLKCHSGTVAQLNVAVDVAKPFSHNPYVTLDVHDPIENPFSMVRHAECQDCHDPHEARAGTATAPWLAGPNQGASGLTSSGQVIAEAVFQFEICYKCHADNNGGQIYVPRQINQANTRFEFDPGNPSFHPVEAPGRNPFVPSLLPPWTTGSMMYCTDCHQSESSPAAGGGGPAGPHGSIFKPLLVANYQYRDGFPENPSQYALCYRCHSRESILDDRSFSKHRKHIVEEKASCATCHDPHGVSSSQGNDLNNSHLINFDVSVVSPSPTTNTLEFVKGMGHGMGSCTLLCHGENHVNKKYK